MSEIEFICADNNELQLEPGAFDHVITDPPYSEYVQARLLAGKKASGAGGAYVKEVAAGFDHLHDLDFVPRFIDAAKRWSLFFCALEDLGRYQAAATSSWVRSGIYCKTRAMPQMTGDRPGNRCEGLAIIHGPGKKAWNGGGTHAFWVAMPENRKTSLHPTAKPLMLCLRLVEQFTNEGELVLDPFCGSGNIGLACALLGRHYFGVDKDPTFIAAARTKLAALDKAAAMAKYAKYKANNWEHADEVG